MNPMSLSERSLQSLADRMQCGRATSPHFRETLEASLVPLVRCALRNGTGLPHLVRWVRETLPRVAGGPDRGQPADPERMARPIARLLCAELLKRRPDRPAPAAHETVVGR
jgi:hypothetical protein